MTKKHRKIKRMLALLGVVVVLASLFVIPSSAWDLTDIPFYNYFDISVVPEVHESTSMSINGTNGDEGTVTLWGAFSNANQMKYIYSNHINRTLADICPDMTLGETYVLSVECVSVEDVGTGAGSGVSPMLQIGLSDGEQGEIWATGESRVCTSEMLSKYVYFYVGRSFDDARYQASDYEVTLRIWINKGETAQEFCSYDIAKEFNERAYNEGFYDGANYANPYKFIRKDNTQLQLNYKDPDFGGAPTPVISYDPGDPIPWDLNGYSFDTRDVPYVVKNTTYKDRYLYEYEILLDLTYDNVVPEGLYLYYEAVNCTVTIMYTSTIPTYDADTGTTYERQETVTVVFDDSLSSQGSIPFTSSLGGTVGDRLTFVRVRFTGQPTWLGAPIHEGSVSIVSNDNPSFILGSEQGYEKGVIVGSEEGYKDGYKDGHYEGYNSGTRDGYANGREDGYYQGRSDEQEQSGFFGMISAVVDVPVRAFKSLFNFEILGTDMTSFALSIVSLSLIVAVIKMVI